MPSKVHPFSNLRGRSQRAAPAVRMKDGSDFRLQLTARPTSLNVCLGHAQPCSETLRLGLGWSSALLSLAARSARGKSFQWSSIYVYMHNASLGLNFNMVRHMMLGH